MKNRLMSRLLVALLIGFGATVTLSQIGNTQAGDITMYCGKHNGVDATMVQNPERTYPLILWVSTLGGHTPRDRCQIISPRFQTYIIEQGMDYIMLDPASNSPVLCASRDRYSGCEAVLFTLKSRADANRIIQQLNNLSRYVGSPISQAGSNPVYFNLKQYLRDLSLENGNTPLLEQ